ncbi:hypothetical protein ANO11243_015180 [Dothideomycetidae sp. 11243]|nr:hypothetical protein ANO11243_015180 [fungal sp. No.11243]
MCGIFLSVAHNTAHPVSVALHDLLKHRGPDSQHCLQIELRGSHDPLHLCCVSSVLSLRGDRTVEQPIAEHLDDSHFKQTSLLCWNGEAWAFAGTSIRGNDSSHVFQTLCHVSRLCKDTSAASPEIAVAEALASYTGPFAFAFYDHLFRRLYCGRDFLGRRSLLFSKNGCGSLLISSVPDGRDHWQEFEADGLYWVELDSTHKGQSLEFRKTPYWCCDEKTRSLRYASSSVLKLPSPMPALDDYTPILNLDAECPPAEAVQRLLMQALRPRLLSIPQRRSKALHRSENAARLAILFSGGIDCTLLARLSHDVLESDEYIDLLNVAFENPRVHRQSTDAGLSPYEQCPDRITAQSSLRQLQKACPSRKWRLVYINVPHSEYTEHRQKIIDLIYPHNTEMDLSIAAALYFAARGRGILIDRSPYDTTARVLLSGLGADELFGGYTRHATAHNRGGFSALQDELALDISRLGKRNLGRDDRVISHWAKEARYPFLDEHLVHWALSATLTEKCGFGQADLVDGNGDILDPAKMLLRCLAVRLKLGSVAHEKKRAIQFGARTAKMDVRKTKGTQLLTIDTG